MARLDASLQQSQKEIASLKQSSQTYTKIRERFFATYKRDNFRDRMAVNDWNSIRDRNSAAHHGDLTQDAFFFDGRRDVWIFKSMYGIGPYEAKLIGTFRCLDT